MDSKHWWKSSGLVAFCVLSVALCGCTSADLLAFKDREITELRSEKERLRESLSQAITKIDRLRDGAKQVEREGRTVLEEIEELRTRLRFANGQLEVAARERGKTETKLQDAEAQVEMLERSLAKVKNVASDSESELTDLRLRSQNFQTKLVKLQTENVSLSQERSKLHSQVDARNEELTKLKVVVRALRAAANEEKLGATIAQLQKENADLRGENVALARRFANLSAHEAELRKELAKQAKGGGSSEATSPAVSARPPGAADLVYVTDPVGLYDEFSGFVTARYRRALTGDIAWDAFDTSVAACGGLVLVLVFGYVLRSRRIYKLKREVDDLRAELYEPKDEPADAIEEDEEEEEEEEEELPRSPRKKPNLRRGGFSAVIAGPGGPPAEQSEASRAVEELVPNTVAASPAPRPVAPVAPPPSPVAAHAEPEKADGSRKLIGARTWEDEESMCLDEESLERTQVIQLTPEDLSAAKLIMPSAASSSSPEEKDTKKVNLLDELKFAVNDKLDSL